MVKKGVAILKAFNTIKSAKKDKAACLEASSYSLANTLTFLNKPTLNLKAFFGLSNSFWQGLAFPGFLGIITSN